MTSASSSRPVQQEIRQLRKQVERLLEQTRSEDPDRLLTVEEAAEILNISERTVATLIADGQIPSVKIRRCRRIPRKALLAYVRRKAGRQQ